MPFSIEDIVAITSLALVFYFSLVCSLHLQCQTKLTLELFSVGIALFLLLAAGSFYSQPENAAPPVYGRKFSYPKKLQGTTISLRWYTRVPGVFAESFESVLVSLRLPFNKRIEPEPHASYEVIGSVSDMTKLFENINYVTVVEAISEEPTRLAARLVLH